MDERWIVKMSKKDAEDYMIGNWKDGAVMITQSPADPSEYTLFEIRNDSLRQFPVFKPGFGNEYCVIVPGLIPFMDVPVVPLDIFAAIHTSVIGQRFRPLIPNATPKPVKLIFDIEGLKEIDNSRLSVEAIIGSGNFFHVQKAMLDSVKAVAVKKLKHVVWYNTAEVYKSEVTALSALHHRQIVSLVGICPGPNLPCIITEYMDNGNLAQYLMKKENQIKDDLHMLSLALQIAEGLEFIGKKNYVHRSLASRKILLNKNMECKISDFGRARLLQPHGQYDRRETIIADYWTALECLKDPKYSTRSDVWSFGVLFMEIMSRGAELYNGMEPYRLRGYLDSGKRLSQPASVNPEFYSLMMRCWKKKPRQRPLAYEVVKTLKKLMDDLIDDFKVVTVDTKTEPSKTEAKSSIYDLD